MWAEQAFGINKLDCTHVWCYATCSFKSIHRFPAGIQDNRPNPSLYGRVKRCGNLSKDGEKYLHFQWRITWQTMLLLLFVVHLQGVCVYIYSYPALKKCILYVSNMPILAGEPLPLRFWQMRIWFLLLNLCRGLNVCDEAYSQSSIDSFSQ